MVIGKMRIDEQARIRFLDDLDHQASELVRDDLFAATSRV